MNNKLSTEVEIAGIQKTDRFTTAIVSCSHIKGSVYMPMVDLSSTGVRLNHAGFEVFYSLVKDFKMTKYFKDLLELDMSTSKDGWTRCTSCIRCEMTEDQAREVFEKLKTIPLNARFFVDNSEMPPGKS
jgi:hypothetical protein